MEHQFDIMDQEPCEMYREKLFLTPSLASTGGCSTKGVKELITLHITRGRNMLLVRIWGRGEKRKPLEFKSMSQKGNCPSK